MRFFRSRSPQLAKAFADAVIAAYEWISENPQLGSPNEGGFRFIRTRRFNYVVHYKQYGELIIVFAVAHGSRKPGYWHRRKYRL